MKFTEIKTAAQILRNGGLVAFPTETVYGLGGDATNESALLRIYKAKNRPANHPLIVHIASTKDLLTWAQEVSPKAKKLAEAFWPGPLTLVLKKRSSISPIVTAHQDTIGLRIPNHPVALALLNAFGGGIAAPSANQFTHVSPTDAQAVQEELGGKIDYVLEGGACAVGLESTIIDLSTEKPILLRPGGVPKAAVESVLGESLHTMNKVPAMRAPGMHLLHYAPRTRTRLYTASNLEELLNEEEAPIAILTRKDYCNASLLSAEIIKMPNDVNAYAQALYRTLRAVDKANYKQILIERVPDESEWDAIRDRLMKASGGRK